MQEERKIVRLLAADLDGKLSVIRALRKIKGVSFMVSNTICTVTNTDPRKKVGLLSEVEIKNLENVMSNLDKHAPDWMLNRRKDRETNINMHLFSTALDLKKRDDINIMKKMHSYRGIRHELGLPVRGQRTRSSFRTQKTVGVTKKKALQARKESKK